MFLGVIDIFYLRMATVAISPVWGTHARSTFMDGSCSHCESVTMPMLRSRLSFLMKGVTSAASHPGPSVVHEAMLVSAQVDSESFSSWKIPKAAPVQTSSGHQQAAKTLW